MPQKTTTAATKMSQEKTAPNLNASEIDITQLSIKELVELKALVDAALAVDIYALKPTDVVLDFTMQLRTAEGVVENNSGQVRLNSLLSPRTLATAPQRFEQAFLSQVYEPINIAAMTVIDNANPTTNRISSARTHIADPFDMAPGLPDVSGSIPV